MEGDRTNGILNRASTIGFISSKVTGLRRGAVLSGEQMRSLFLRAGVCISTSIHPYFVSAQQLSTDPQGSGVIVSAVRWMQGTLLGTVATVVAVIAIAVVGLMMLTGRINWRYGAVVILGCFILFGAASIVAGIQSTASLSAAG